MKKVVALIAIIITVIVGLIFSLDNQDESESIKAQITIV